MVDEDTPLKESGDPDKVPPGSYWTGLVDAARVARELDYKPRLTYEDGMREAEQYWKEQRAASQPV